MLQAFHAFGSKEAGFAYLKKLQVNNLGPSSSTGKLAALVNKGELYVANGDLQMNIAQMAQNPNLRVFFPAGPDGKRSTFALPYYIGLVQRRAPRRERQEADRLPAEQGGAARVSSVAQGIPVRTDVHPTDDNYKSDRVADAGRRDLESGLAAGADGPAGGRGALAQGDRELI